MELDGLFDLRQRLVVDGTHVLRQPGLINRPHLGYLQLGVDGKACKRMAGEALPHFMLDKSRACGKCKENNLHAVVSCYTGERPHTAIKHNASIKRGVHHGPKKN
jgi:hypothetical protein